jgi:glycosyltransferase involved in cell wall biosynthesis
MSRRPPAVRHEASGATSAPPRPPITALVLTFNEEANLERVLARLHWAEEIVVLDSYSTDRTLEIARRHPRVRVEQRPFDNHVDQWNHGLRCVRTPWVLSLDADYVLSDELVAELRDQPLEAGAYLASFRYCIGGRPLRGSLYPARVVLFRTADATYVADGHTQRLQIAAPVRRLSGCIFHDDRKPLAHWLDAQRRYAALECAKLTALPDAALRRTDRVRRLKWLAPLVMPWYCLLGKGLLLDGWPGLYYTCQRTYFELLLALELFEHDRHSTP